MRAAREFGFDAVQIFTKNNNRWDGKPLAVTTVIHLHAILRKAFRDAVIIDGLIGSNPLERAKRPRVPAREPGTVWTIAQLQVSLATARQHDLDCAARLLPAEDTVPAAETVSHSMAPLLAA